MANEFRVKNGLIIATLDAGTANYNQFLVANSDNKVLRRTASQVTAELGALTTYNASDNYAFKTVAVTGQTSVVAASNTDTLTLVPGTNITMTTNNTTKTITINSSGGGSVTDNIFTFVLDASRSESANVGTVSGIYTFRFPYDFEITDVMASIARFSDADLEVDILTGTSISTVDSIFDSGGSPTTLVIRASHDSSHTFPGGQPTIQNPNASMNDLLSINTSYNGTPTSEAGGLKVYITGKIL